MSYLAKLRREIGRQKTILVYATVIAQDSAERILLQRRSDFAWWGLPGGILEYGEDIDTCARRELREETGLEVGPLRLVGIYTSPRYDVVYPNGDEVQQFTICFAGQVAGGALQPDGVEALGLEFFEPAAASRQWLPAWYAAMIDDAMSSSEPSFDVAEPAPTAPVESVATTQLRQAGHIMPVAIAIVQRPDGGLYVPVDGQGQRSFPMTQVNLGETAAHAALRAAGSVVPPGARPERLLGVISSPGALRWAADESHHVVAAVFLIRTHAGRAARMVATDWIAPESLESVSVPLQVALFRAIRRALDGDHFVDPLE